MEKIKVEKLIVKIAKGCKTGCNLCIEGQKKDVEFFDADEVTQLLRALEASRNIIDMSNISVFTFYGSTVLKHPDILRLMDIVISIIPDVTFCMDIGDVVPYDQGYIDYLQEITKKYRVIYVFVRNVHDMGLVKNMSDWKRFFTFLAENPTFLSREPSIRYGKNDYLSLKILSKIFDSIPNHIKPTYAKHPYADHEKKKFFSEKLGTSTCKYYTDLRQDVTNNTLVFGHDENEVNLQLDGSLTIHTNICYLSKYRYITNVFNSQQQITQDLDQFVLNLKNVNEGSHSLEEACFKCIYGINT